MVFQWFPYDFAMIPVDLNRRPSPDPGLSYVFLWFCMFSFYGFAMFPVDFNRRPSPDPWLSFVSLWFSSGFPMFLLLCFQLISIGPRPIFSYLTISDSFP